MNKQPILKIFEKKVNCSNNNPEVIIQKKEQNKSNSIIKKLYQNSLLVIILSLIIIFFRNSFIIYYFEKTKMNGLQISMCVIAKEENKYIKEFVKYYKNIGVSKIFIFDNNDLQGENFENVINEEIEEGFVKIINYRNKKSSQMKAYTKCFKNNQKKYDWIMFYDVDEYLTIINKTLNDFLNNKKFLPCENIKLNWKMYGDNDLLFYENKPLLERFKIPLPTLEKKKGDSKVPNDCVKSLIKGKRSFFQKKIIFTENPHYPKNIKYSCDSEGNKIKNDSPFNDYNLKTAYLKHFFTKSTEEYAHKIMRGRATMQQKRKIEEYFLYNKLSKEKIKLLESLTHSNLSKIKI